MKNQVKEFINEVAKISHATNLYKADECMTFEYFYSFVGFIGNNYFHVVLSKLKGNFTHETEIMNTTDSPEEIKSILEKHGLL